MDLVPSQRYRMRLPSRWPMFVLALVAAVFLWVLWKRESFAVSPTLLFFIQSFAGNWSPPKPEHLDAGWFVVSAMIAISLNLGAFAALMTNLRSLAKLERKQLMQTSRIFLLRDTVVKDELYKILETRLNLSPEELEEWHNKIEEAYKSGTNAWAKKTLPRIFGKDGTSEFFRMVDEEFQPSNR